MTVALTVAQVCFAFPELSPERAAALLAIIQLAREESNAGTVRGPVHLRSALVDQVRVG